MFVVLGGALMAFWRSSLAEHTIPSSVAATVMMSL